MHDPVWTSMIDLPTTTPILTEIFGTADYLVRGGGGDFCLPGAVEYQHLHWDFKDPLTMPAERLQQAAALGIELRKRPGLRRTRSRNAAARRRTHAAARHHQLSDVGTDVGERTDPADSRHARVAEPHRRLRPTNRNGCASPHSLAHPPGAGVFRDTRAWHGGTPNLSRDVRPMPNIEYVAPWFNTFMFTQSMPHELWADLSPHAQRLCRYIKCEPGVWPRGAGVMHPLASKRKEAFERVAVPAGKASK